MTININGRSHNWYTGWISVEEIALLAFKSYNNADDEYRISYRKVGQIPGSEPINFKGFDVPVSDMIMIYITMSKPINPVEQNPYTQSFTRRELEMAYCIALLNRRDCTIDMLSEELKVAKDKIEQIVKFILELREAK